MSTAKPLENSENSLGPFWGRMVKEQDSEAQKNDLD